jgi:hypothetical protein
MVLFQAAPSVLSRGRNRPINTRVTGITLHPQPDIPRNCVVSVAYTSPLPPAQIIFCSGGRAYTQAKRSEYRGQNWQIRFDFKNARTLWRIPPWAWDSNSRDSVGPFPNTHRPAAWPASRHRPGVGDQRWRSCLLWQAGMRPGARVGTRGRGAGVARAARGVTRVASVPLAWRVAPADRRLAAAGAGGCGETATVTAVPRRLAAVVTG